MQTATDMDNRAAARHPRSHTAPAATGIKAINTSLNIPAVVQSLVMCGKRAG
jgi:hypothetical protein